MMASLKTWWRAARFRTVLLSLSGVLMGGFLSVASGYYHVGAVALAALTAILLQILSNLANDYGDFKKGVDNAHRTGPARALQSGDLTEQELRRGIVAVSNLTLLSGAALFGMAWSYISWRELAVFAALGLCAIAAALCYTLGRRPYGYRGLGDLFCFVFFGWVAVAGTFYLSSNRFEPWTLLPATALGCCSVAVLNINNLRDHDNDRATGKRTLVVKIGLKAAFVYHIALTVIPFLCLTVFLWHGHKPWYSYAFWLLFPLFMKDLRTIRQTLQSGVPDPLLPRQVLHTFLLTVVFGLLLVL